MHLAITFYNLFDAILSFDVVCNDSLVMNYIITK